MTYEASTFMYAIAVSIFAIGGMCGGFIGGWIANRFGRKGGLLVNNVVGIIAAMAMFFSKYVTSYELLIFGRYLIGVNCGEFQQAIKIQITHTNAKMASWAAGNTENEYRMESIIASGKHGEKTEIKLLLSFLLSVLYHGLNHNFLKSERFSRILLLTFYG